MEDPAKVCQEAGMATLMLEQPIANPREKVNCLICYDDFEAKDTFALGCGHRYCTSCWRVYLEVRTRFCALPGLTTQKKDAHQGGSRVHHHSLHAAQV